MKKLFTGIISLALAASMSLSAFAANTATNDGTAGTDITVNGKFQEGAPATETVSVDLVWDDMSFTYTEGSKGIWNTKTHAYDNPTAGGWAATNGTDPKITVTNHSNVEVNALFTFSTDISGLNGSFTNDSLVLATAENTLPDNAPTGETAFSVSGTGIDADKALGTITVSVTKKDPEAMYKVTAEQFANIAETSNNFTVSIASGGDSMAVYFGGSSIMTNALLSDSYNGIYTFDGTNYYCYIQEEKDGDWLLENDESNQLYNEMRQLANILPYLKDSYASFAYDPTTHTYKSTGAFAIAGFGNVTEASVGFENGELKSASIALEDGTVYTYTECGTTVVEIPTDIHEHTFAAEWSSNYYGHWHAATCRHDTEKRDYAEHTLENGVCTVCGYTEST